jgi:hypothetical protein
MYSAASSFPVPVSPVIRTVQLEAAILARDSLISWRELLDPIILALFWGKDCLLRDIRRFLAHNLAEPAPQKDSKTPVIADSPRRVTAGIDGGQPASSQFQQSGS